MIEIENKLNLISLQDTDSEDVKLVVPTKAVTIQPHSRAVIDSEIRVVSPDGLVAVADADVDENENEYVIYCDSNVDDDEDDIVFTIINLTDKELKLTKNLPIGKLYFYRSYVDVVQPVAFAQDGVEIIDRENNIANISTSYSNESKQIIIDLK
jgi:dUTPase